MAKTEDFIKPYRPTGNLELDNALYKGIFYIDDSSLEHERIALVKIGEGHYVIDLGRKRKIMKVNSKDGNLTLLTKIGDEVEEETLLSRFNKKVEEIIFLNEEHLENVPLDDLDLLIEEQHTEDIADEADSIIYKTSTKVLNSYRRAVQRGEVEPTFDIEGRSNEL